jgi:hypothetical protein
VEGGKKTIKAHIWVASVPDWGVGYASLLFMYLENLFNLLRYPLSLCSEVAGKVSLCEGKSLRDRRIKRRMTSLIPPGVENRKSPTATVTAAAVTTTISTPTPAETASSTPANSGDTVNTYGDAQASNDNGDTTSDNEDENLSMKRSLLRRAERSHSRLPGIRKIPLRAIGIILVIALVNVVVWIAAAIVLVCGPCSSKLFMNFSLLDSGLPFDSISTRESQFSYMFCYLRGW